MYARETITHIHGYLFNFEVCINCFNTNENWNVHVIFHVRAYFCQGKWQKTNNNNNNNTVTMGKQKRCGCRIKYDLNHVKKKNNIKNLQKISSEKHSIEGVFIHLIVLLKSEGKRIFSAHSFIYNLKSFSTLLHNQILILWIYFDHIIISNAYSYVLLFYVWHFDKRHLSLNEIQ